ncbi:MAG: 4Fe-4S dicluster domain-containing protein [Firmicutes bacterium]|nr:4Fe-4S dicluster domain-containing protein [Bacillota bacterium]
MDSSRPGRARIPASRVDAFLRALGAGFEVFAPQEDATSGMVHFARLREGSPVVVGGPNTAVPPKSLFFPQSETLFSFVKGRDSLEITDSISRPGGGRRLVFGVRPCDLVALARLDLVFAKDIADPYYTSKRESTIIIGLGCEEPSRTCFCTSFGYGPGDGQGADVFLLPSSGGQGGEVLYTVQVFTESGLKFAEEHSSFFEGRGQVALEQELSEDPEVKALRKELAKRVKTRVDPAGVELEMRQLWDAPYWGTLSRRCLACGICTYNCPTCHCFDIHDTNRLSMGERFRCWDTCMSRAFTLAAGGHNPRPTKRERVRQRFMHKLRYFKDRYGEQLCIGCGRCVEQCPTNIDIRKIIDDVHDLVSGKEAAAGA